jgi:hypothetical protein
MSILRYVASAFHLIPLIQDDAEPSEPMCDFGPLRESEVLDLLDQTIYRRVDDAPDQGSRSKHIQ